ncbi:Hypothetical protein CINCED_3A000740 [Cinara cedri]|uniref:Uncharacterized protein n=1 Tax=Cinara cedri TaxID=506608 RepID=A0A5E4MBC4_9HEMI|nr:Hypothetical protein CINCED_3A000740 [Cinara cedri]
MVAFASAVDFYLNLSLLEPLTGSDRPSPSYLSRHHSESFGGLLSHLVHAFNGGFGDNFGDPGNLIPGHTVPPRRGGSRGRTGITSERHVGLPGASPGCG